MRDYQTYAHTEEATGDSARELWGVPAAAIGKWVRETLKASWREVVGVVGDERDDGVNQKAPTIVFWPVLMDDFSGDKTIAQRSVAIMIRSGAGSSAFLNEISQAVWSVNSSFPLPACARFNRSTTNR